MFCPHYWSKMVYKCCFILTMWKNIWNPFWLLQHGSLFPPQDKNNKCLTILTLFQNSELRDINSELWDLNAESRETKSELWDKIKVKHFFFQIQFNRSFCEMVYLTIIKDCDYNLREIISVSWSTDCDEIKMGNFNLTRHFLWDVNLKLWEQKSEF